jgi:hypothetical protein
VLWFTYEELTTQPERLRDRILDFMPALGGLDVQRAFAVHSLHGPVARPLTNLNTEQIGRLDTGAVRAINDVLAAAPDVMGFFHYPYRCV